MSNNNTSTGFSQNININFGGISIQGNLLSYDKELVEKLKEVRNGIDFLLLLHGYQSKSVDLIKGDEPSPEEYVDEEVSTETFYGLDNAKLKRKTAGIYTDYERMYYILYCNHSNLSYPNMFFKDDELKGVSLTTFWKDLVKDVAKDHKDFGIDLVKSAKLVESRLLDIEIKVSTFFDEIKSRTKGYKFMNVSAISKRLDVFRASANNITDMIKETVPYCKKVTKQDLCLAFGIKESLVLNTSNKDLAMYYIKVDELDVLFNKLVNTIPVNKTFYTDIFGFRTRFARSAGL